ncbi:glycosyltransferase [Actinoplanes solisilvae]|uniref:glycosyltransferase n=1 Tax=Actinoplanes solisilvae TaxID=2486853 RepID=UPI001F0BAD6A|nr:glycosyltransferase [Actinoplanes solisilvae]
MEISVIVLTYNSARTIDRCLDSLVAQEVAPAEIIIVDDDSTDTTLAAVEEFRGRCDIPVSVLRNGQHNISRGRNLGMAVARTRLVAFLDSDAWAATDWTRKLIATFDRDARLGVIGGGVDVAHASPFAEAIAVNDETIRQLATSEELLIAGCNMAVDLTAVADERFDERWIHAEDSEFVDRVEDRCRWAAVPEARVWHESRATLRGYMRQMYKYGLWRVRYAASTRKVRTIDYVPTTVMIAAAILGAAVSPWLLLAVPAMSLAEAAFVIAYRRPPVRLWPLMVIGWLAKNTAWGLGVLVAIVQQVTARSQVPPRLTRTAS